MGTRLSVLQVQQLYTAGISSLEAYCQYPIIELVSQPKNKMATSHVLQIHTHARFPQSKEWPTYRVAVPTGNALASQRSIFRENRLKFWPSSATEKVSIVYGTKVE